MTPQSGTFSSRLIAVLLLALVLLIAYQAAIRPVVDLYRDNAAAIATKTDRLQRYRRVAGEREALADQLSRLQRDRSAVAGYIAQSSDALAMTAVQDQARAAISAEGGEVKSVELLPGSTIEEHPTVRRLGLRIRFSASMEGLARVVHALEAAEPYLFIDKLLASASGGGLGTDRQERGRQLDISLDILSYAQTPSQASSATRTIDHGT